MDQISTDDNPDIDARGLYCPHGERVADPLPDRTFQLVDMWPCGVCDSDAFCRFLADGHLQPTYTCVVAQ